MDRRSLTVFLDAVTWARLLQASRETGRDVATLAADGISEYMLQGFQDRPNEDPGKDWQR